MTHTDTSVDELCELIYELLDAHDDTSRIVAELEPAGAWAIHLDYLRTLQRRGRELLAGVCAATVYRPAGGLR